MPAPVRRFTMGCLALVTKQVGQLRVLECCTRGAGHRFPWPASGTVEGRRQKPIACPTCTQLTHLFHDKHLSHLSRLIGRDRNHPSVVIWPLGNEEGKQGTDRGARIGSRRSRACAWQPRGAAQSRNRGRRTAPKRTHRTRYPPTRRWR